MATQSAVDLTLAAQETGKLVDLLDNSCHELNYVKFFRQNLYLPSIFKIECDIEHYQDTAKVTAVIYFNVAFKYQHYFTLRNSFANVDDDRLFLCK